MATKIVKVQTGEELIAMVTENFEGEKITSYTLKNPCMVVPVPTKGGGANIAVVPWMASVKQDQGIVLPASYVMFTAEPATDLANEFNQAFGGIVVPSKDIATPGLKLTV
jgi:hypothetical protein